MIKQDKNFENHETDKNGITIGEFLRFLREEQQITLKQLSCGLCSVPTLSRIECNERDISMLLAERILERLGYQPNKYELYCSDKEFEWYEKRCEISRLKKKKNFLQMEEMLTQYEREAGKQGDHLQEQFIKSGKAVLEIERGQMEEGILYIKEAISLTVAEWKGDSFTQQLLGLEELELFNILADAYERVEERENAYQIWENILNYLEQTKTRKEQMAELYTYVISRMIPYMLKCKMIKKALNLCDKGLATAPVTLQINYCCELLCWKAKCMRELYLQNKIERKELLYSYHFAYYVCGAYEKSELVQEMEFYLREAI